jgi:amino acid transporter
LAKERVYTRDATGLVREIGPWSALFMSWNTYSVGVGSVLIFLVAFYPYPGADMVVSVFLGFLLAVIVGLIYYIFMSAMPRSGGEYVFISRTISPSFGFTVNWAYTISFMMYLGPIMSFVYVPLVISPSLTFIGLVANSTALASFGLWISAGTGLYVFSVAVYLVVAGILTFGVGIAAKASTVLFWLGAAAIIIMIGIFAVTPNSVWISTLDSFVTKYTGETNFYQFVINTASSTGLKVPAYNLSDTFGSLIISYTTFQGVWFTAYYAGELKKSNRSLLYGMIGAAGVGMVMLCLLVLVAIPALGRNFLVSLAYLFYGNPSALAPYLPSGLIPSTPFYALVLGNNIVVQVIIAVGFIAAAFSSVLGVWFALTRNVFAWAFDRVVPTKFAYVDSRFHSPLAANLLILVAAIIGLTLTIYTTLFGFINQLLFAFLCLAIIGVVAMVIPFHNKSIYEKTALKRSVAGIPLMTILGALLTLTSIYGEYVAATNSFISGPLTIQTWGIVIVTFALGPIIYYASRAYHKSRENIDIALSFKEIPPE